jgi:hypothetical protein
MTARTIILAALLLTAVLLGLAGTVGACDFDTDCSPGRRGIFPGNRYDQQPYEDPLDLNETSGNTCSFSTECGPGSICFKKGGAIDGVCLPKWDFRDRRWKRR